jgi:hypothetical protein
VKFMKYSTGVQAIKVWEPLDYTVVRKSIFLDDHCIKNSNQ